MTAPGADASLEALIARVRQAMADPSSVSSDAPAAEGSAGAEGEAAGGRVRAAVTSDGHVRSLTISPDMMREPLADIADAVVAAINAASAHHGDVDASPLVDVLTQVREQARHELAIVSTGFGDVEAGVRAVRAAQHAQQPLGRQP